MYFNTGLRTSIDIFYAEINLNLVAIINNGRLGVMKILNTGKRLISVYWFITLSP
jgi:hypothetical protein